MTDIRLTTFYIGQNPTTIEVKMCQSCPHKYGKICKDIREFWCERTGSSLNPSKLYQIDGSCDLPKKESEQE